MTRKSREIGLKIAPRKQKILSMTNSIETAVKLNGEYVEDVDEYNVRYFSLIFNVDEFMYLYD